MKHPARGIAAAVGAALIALTLLFASQLHVSPQFTGGALLGKPVPNIDLPALSGHGRIRSSDFEGRVTLVNFWNTWCIPCIQEHPFLTAFYIRHQHDPDFQMIGIVRDDTASAARAWVAAHHDGWQFAMDPTGQAALNFGTTGQPETYMIAPNGIVAGLQRSAVTVSGLEKMLAVARGS